MLDVLSQLRNALAKIPSAIVGIIGIITTLVTFVVLFRQNLYLVILILLSLILGTALVVSTFVFVSKTNSTISAGNRVYRFPSARHWALVAIIIIVTLVGAIFLIEPSRTFVIEAVIGSPTPEQNLLYIDNVLQILSDEPPSSSDVSFDLDIVVRNPSNEPINITAIILLFDGSPTGGLSSGDTITGIYVIKVDEDSTFMEGELGRFAAQAWYPNTEKETLMITAPIGQNLEPQTTDRFRVSVVISRDTLNAQSFRSPLESLQIKLIYNQGRQASSEIITLSH